MIDHNDYSITFLLVILFLLVLVSAFFSCSEIGMMSLNQYRLRHLVRKKNRRAARVAKLLEKPEQFLAVVLVGNTCANIVASTIATLIGQRLSGDTGVAIATGILTLVVLVFAEMAPKTLAALYPQPIALYCSFLLYWLLKIFSPLVWLLNKFVMLFLTLCGVNTNAQNKETLSTEELRTVVYETGSMIPKQHKKMLLSILDLEKVTVDDIMVERNDIVAIDITLPWSEIRDQFEVTQHTRLPIYEGTMDSVIGVIHIRHVLNLFLEELLDKEHLKSLAEPCYFVPEGTGLHQQLFNFQQAKKRTALVVDEYGDIQGLVTLEDILEEIVGDFTTDMASMVKEIYPQDDGSFLIDGSAYVRDLNSSLSWKLPLLGPRTLSGLIIEYLGFIPPVQSCLKIKNYKIEILHVKDNMIKMVRVNPPVKPS
jgi:Mg2+/Co2+ transporter CorB